MKLNDYVKQVSIEDFGKPFNHQALWNKRLKTTGGRFFPKDGHLDFNPKIYDVFGQDIFRQIVRHELCHYHLYYAGMGYKHRDKEFKHLLKAVDGLRYAPSLQEPLQNPYHYCCQSCQQDFFRKRRIKLEQYRCGKCGGHLLFLEKNQP